MKYFNNCTEESEAKEIYKGLYMTNHANAEIMQEINSELKRTLLTIETLHKFNDIKKEIPETTANDKKEQIQKAAQFAKSLNVNVEITGLWVWVTDVRREDREKQQQLKANGFKYSPKKSAWYFHNMQGFRTTKHLSLEQIRIKYGNEVTEQKLF